MNAKELFELCSPLWEKASETKPRLFAWHKCGDNEGFIATLPNWEEGVDQDTEISDGLVKCACRVAVEDWLKQHPAVDVLMLGAEPHEKGLLCSVWFGPGQDQARSGPTLLHALVAAALSLAPPVAQPPTG